MVPTSAFLMDEPLYNLDVELELHARRAEADLGVTTIYVTHDQIEAMTLTHQQLISLRAKLRLFDPASGDRIAAVLAGYALQKLRQRCPELRGVAAGDRPTST